ncbi:MAG: glycosyltransferase family 2 protein [Candidatus Omnitrophota bacterium]|nr:MAG: glycosyltransferase family 2 protein [Candidatus Omnitrophota bacterium]
MPVYNEKGTILKVIDKILRLDTLKELVIVDDGSADGTRELLKNEDFGPKVRKIFHERNFGKGRALKTGFEHANGDIITVQDADLEYDPGEFKELIGPIKEGRADVVYGSRLSGGKAQRVYMFWHKIGNYVITFLANLLYNSTLTDIETCYKVFKKEVIKNIDIKSRGFSVEPEITAKILKKKNLRIYEMPISYYGRTYKEGKKITWKQGFSAIAALLWYRFFD